MGLARSKDALTHEVLAERSHAKDAKNSSTIWDREDDLQDIWKIQHVDKVLLALTFGHI